MLNSKNVFTILFLFSITALFSQSQTIGSTPGSMVTFDQSGLYSLTVPVSVVVTIEVWGAGGAGGDGGNAGGGGGGGAYAKSTGITLLSSGSPFNTVNVGAGGVPSGANGGPSSFNGVTAQGGLTSGSNGIGGLGATVGTSGNTANFAGGKGGNRFGANEDGGAGGGSGGSTQKGFDGANGPDALGNNVVAIGGAGGSLGGGKGGNGADADDVPVAQNGSAPGGGGGGKSKGAGTISGSGANGRVKVTVESLLPVELATFSGKVVNEIINLSWITLSETNNEKFIIESSKDGIHFQSAGEVEGNGNSQRKKEYQFVFENPSAGLNYFRLKQVDYDGNYSLSNIIKVLFENKREITLYPTVSNGILRLQNLPNEADLRIMNSQGKIIRNQEFNGLTNLEIDISDLSNGIYYIEIGRVDQRQVKRFIKID